MTIPSEIGAGAHRRVTDLLSLRGRIALITGATGHLGSAMAQALAEAGARVIVSSRRLVDARDVAQQLPRTAECAAHLGVELDHMEVESLGDAFASALSAANGRIDVLVNNGNAALASDWRTVTGQDFTRHLGNATGYFLLSRMMRDHVVRRGGTGSIILVGSMYGLVASYPDAYADVASASPVAYHVLKGGIIQMTRHLAVYWANDHVRVNCLSPGPFPPPGRIPAVLVERLRTRSPMARMGHPDEMKGPVVFLASDASSYVTGQNLVIDGGWTAW